MRVYCRPRAGRIEEETRLARSVELVAQRRRIENHLRAQSRAVKAQAEQFEEWTSALQAETTKWVLAIGLLWFLDEIASFIPYTVAVFADV